MNAKESIYNLFLDGTLALKTATEICKILQIPFREKKRLTDVLFALQDEGKIFENNGGRYGTAEQLGLIVGTIIGNERGFAFLSPKDSAYGKDFFIPPKNLHGALHGDTVLIERVFERSDDEANVLRILERGYTKIVGTFRKDRRSGYLIPDEKRFSSDIYIPLSACANIKSGVKAVAQITSYPHGKAPGGEIVEVLGEEDDFFAEELSLIRSYGLDESFPAAVEKEAQRQQRKGISATD